MDLDPVLLSRLQFAWVMGWHILLPAFTVGLASFIAILEGVHAATQNPGISPAFPVLAESLCDFVRDGRRDRDRHAVPIRHELEPLLGCCRKHDFAALGL